MWRFFTNVSLLLDIVNCETVLFLLLELLRLQASSMIKTLRGDFDLAMKDSENDDQRFADALIIRKVSIHPSIRLFIETSSTGCMFSVEFSSKLASE